MTYEATDAQYTALAKAVEHWGRVWRNRLTFAWEIASYPAALKPYSPELQQLRNCAGTDWLYKFKFES